MLLSMSKLKVFLLKANTLTKVLNKHVKKTVDLSRLVAIVQLVIVIVLAMLFQEDLFPSQLMLPTGLNIQVECSVTVLQNSIMGFYSPE